MSWQSCLVVLHPFESYEHQKCTDLYRDHFPRERLVVIFDSWKETAFQGTQLNQL